MGKEIIRVGTFNVENSKVNRAGGLRPDGLDNSELLAKEIQGFDLLGTQELTMGFANTLKLKMGKYKLYGDYRYGKLTSKIPLSNKIPSNENNNIITNKSVIFNKTITLPWMSKNIKDLPVSITKLSILPCIATIVVAVVNGEKICMINTHLDYHVKSVQKLQLEMLKDLINKYKKEYPIILTGDFNMELSDLQFSKFVDDIKPDLQRVEVDEKTWHGSYGRSACVDHIFVSNDYEIQDKGIINSNGVSDHDIVYADIKKKQKKN